MYRAYANVCYGDSNLRRLRDEDRELLELVLKADEGSSEYEAPLYEQLTELARKAIDKMDARSLVITILGIAVVIGGVEISKAWIAERQEARQAEQAVELSRQETERLRLISEAVRQQPFQAEAREAFEVP